MLNAQGLASLAPLASPLPPPPEGDVLAPDQWDTLLAILDAFLCPVAPASAAVTSLKSFLPAAVGEEDLVSYFDERPSAIPQFKTYLHRKLGHYLPPSDLKGLQFILNALNTRLGCLILTSSPTPLQHHDVPTRVSILLAWATSRLPLLRGLFRSLGLLARQAWVALSPGLPKIIDFPSTPVHVERHDSFDFRFKEFSGSSDQPISLTTDVVIVGSGCGAGVAALHLATAGYKVLVLEKSYHFPSTHFPMDAASAGVHLMENGGGVVVDDQSMVLLAGSTWGGGGTVNWSASLQPQHFVREEWAESGLNFATSAEFQDCLDHVCEQMGVCKSTDEDALGKIEQNFANATLLEGARRLGYAPEIVPQNTAGKRHFCGYCSEGCASATKQGPANYWFPRAAEKGAEFIEGCWVEEVLWEEPSAHQAGWTPAVFASAASPTRKAIGVKASWTSRDRHTTVPLTVKAQRIIVSAGTLNSPLLLLRSGLDNPHIGANLHLHPTLPLAAVWPHVVRPWEGSILTSAVTSLENQDGCFHGPKLEALASTPGYLLPWLP